MKEAWGHLRGGVLTPRRAALSVGVGLTVGMTPLYGFHLWIVLGICLPLQLDAALAYLAANVSIPILAPFILLAEVEVGALLRTGHFLAIAAAEAQTHAFGVFLKELALGTAVVAPATGLAGALVAWGIAAHATKGIERPDADRELEAAVEHVAARYASGRRFAFHYVRGKLASDPVARKVAGLDALGAVVDLGCGRGQLAALLLETKRATSVLGVDWDAAKVEDARRACTGLDATFDVGDVRAFEAPKADTALLIDVLHYFADEEQDAILARAADAGRTRVVVRELDPDRGWRSAVTRTQERVTTALGVNRGARVNVRPIRAIVSALETRGYACTVEPCWGGTPFSNVLVVGTRRESV